MTRSVRRLIYSAYGYACKRWPKSCEVRFIRTTLLTLPVLLILFVPSTLAAQAKAKQREATKQSSPTAEPSPQPTPVVPPNPLVIGVPQIGTESIQLNQRLRSLPDRIVSEESVIGNEQRIRSLKGTIAEKSEETASIIRSGAVLIELEQLSMDWGALNEEVASLSETLVKQLTILDNELRSLKSDDSRWSATAAETNPEQSLPELLALTSKAVGDLTVAIKLVEERRGRVVSLQHALAEQSSIVISESENVKKAIEVSQRSLLAVDSPPLWKVQFSSQPDENLARLLRRSYAGDLRRVKAFVISKRSAFIFVGLLTLSALIFFWRLKRQSGSELERKRDLIFERPLSVALLVGITATMTLFHDAPKGARSLLYLIGVVPVVRLLKPRLSLRGRQMLIGSIVSLLVWQFIVLPRLPLWIKRDLLQIFVVLVVGWFGWLIYKKQQDNLMKPGFSLATMAVQLGIALLVVAFFANLFGYVGLSDLLIQGTLVGVYRGITLYAIVVVGSLLIAVALQAETSQRFATLRTSANSLVRRLSYALAGIMLLVWIHQVLNLFAVRQQVYAAISLALNYQIKIGSATIAVSNIVAFILTLLLGYLVAVVLRAILGEEILPRLKLARGLPNAIATITHYVLLLLIFILALAAAGVELSKFTILTGAVGVGLGFGLQNIVNNFVSGLILLFERPVRIGDTLEVGGIGGEVTKIGFRSSTLHAFDGSDLIIPNAELISQRVINWTLTGTRRQIVLNIHVAYGNDPTQVRDLLRKTVVGHPGVLGSPVPMTLFTGFGDSALNFEIRCWAPRPDVVAELRSDVAISIAAALNQAGIKVPVPRRDLHITSDRNANGVASEDSGELLQQ